jgi:hypothetical protein
VEQKDTNPSLAKVDCKKDTKGDLDFSKAANGIFTCTITGSNLDKIASLRLRNAQDKTDTKTADGKVNGDAVTFQSAQLCALEKPAYDVFIETKDGAETGSGIPPVHFDVNPFLTDDPEPVQVPLDKLSGKGAVAVLVKLKGCHLDKVTGIHLEAKDIKMDTTKPPANQSATGLSFDVTAEMLAKAKIPAGDYSSTNPLGFAISLATKDAKNPLPTEKHLQGIGKVIAAAASTVPQLVLGAFPKSVTSGAQTQFTVTAKDATGKVNTGFNGTVKLATTDKNASPLPDYTFVLADKGVGKFSITFKTKGKQTITATSTGFKTASASTVVK